MFKHRRFKHRSVTFGNDRRHFIVFLRRPWVFGGDYLLEGWQEGVVAFMRQRHMWCLKLAFVGFYYCDDRELFDSVTRLTDG